MEVKSEVSPASVRAMARKLLRWAEEMEAQMLPQQLSAAAGNACGRGDLSTALEMTTGEEDGACGRGDLSTRPTALVEMTTGEEDGACGRGDLSTRPTALVEMTTGEVRGLLAEKCAAGYGVQVQGIIQAFGAEKFSEVDPADYPAVMRAASLLGAEGGDADAG